MAGNEIGPKPNPRGGKYCVAGRPNGQSCSNSQFTKGISMHQFPRDAKTNQAWTTFVRRHRPNFIPLAKSFLCSSHFDISSFSRRNLAIIGDLGGRRVLNKDAIPRIDTNIQAESVWKQPTALSFTARQRRKMKRDCRTARLEMPVTSAEKCDENPVSSHVPAVISPDDLQEEETTVEPLPPPLHAAECRCKMLSKKVVALQKKMSRYKKRELNLQEHLQNQLQDRSGESEVDTDSEVDRPTEIEVDTESEVDRPTEIEVDTESEEGGTYGHDGEDGMLPDDFEWTTAECESNSDSDFPEDTDLRHDFGPASKKSAKVEFEDKPATTEPKFMVYSSLLLQLFTLFCFKCKAPNPKAIVKGNGTMATIIQTCECCNKSFTWRSQPFVFGKYPAGNIMMSLAILMSGFSISQALLLFKHMGLHAITSRTYFLHQQSFLFPAILRYWEKYQAALLEQLRKLKDITWSGDGRFDSMGHNAKYGVYSMFCNTISKVVHFELLQSNQCGSSNAMELDGAKRCFSFLAKVELKVQVFISDRHLSIAKWLKSQSSVLHLYDLWHVSKSLTKKLTKASREAGCQILKFWIKGVRNHLYWCATSTKQGFGELIAAKWVALARHVANKHVGHRTVAYDKLHSVITNTRFLNDVRKLSSDDQTSCLEGFHSTLNHWHPKMTHFSWLGTYCRHVLAILHFNENLHREAKTNKDGITCYNVRWPKFKLGEEVVREVAVPPTYDYVKQLSETLFTSDRATLRSTLEKYSLQAPEPLTSQFENRKTKIEAIKHHHHRSKYSTPLFPDGEEQVQMKRAADSMPVSKNIKKKKLQPKL